jgi:hypothetical protein
MRVLGCCIGPAILATSLRQYIARSGPEAHHDVWTLLAV